MNSYSTVLPSRSDAYTVYDLSKNDRPAAELRMLPGDLSRSGFLGINESLLEVCEKDLATLLRLKVSCDNISDNLEFLVESAKQAVQGTLSDVAKIGKFLVIGAHYKPDGIQACAFTKGNQPCHKSDIPTYSEEGEITIKNTESKKEFSFNPILIPMIRYHALFCGNVPNRLDPEIVCETLELKPDADLKKVRVEEKVWQLQERYTITKENTQLALKNTDVTLIVDDYATAYLGIANQDLRDFEWEMEQTPGSGGTPSKLFEEFDLCNEEIASQNLVEKKSDRLYCHVFNQKQRLSGIFPEIAGVVLDQGIVEKGIYVFELNKYSIARSVK